MSVPKKDAAKFKVVISGEQTVRYSRTVEMTEEQWADIKKLYADVDDDAIAELTQDYCDGNDIDDADDMEECSYRRLGPDGKTAERLP